MREFHGVKLEVIYFDRGMDVVTSSPNDPVAEIVPGEDWNGKNDLVRRKDQLDKLLK